MPRDFKTFAKENENISSKNKDKTAEYEEILNTETGYYEVTEKNA